MKAFCTKIYIRLFEMISSKCACTDLPERYLHAHLVSVITTGILMWSYAFLAYFTISSPVPGIVGFTASTVHLLSPLLYRRSSNYLFNTSVMLGSGMAHQCTFAYYTGGFDSNILIWLGILPMLGGVMAGRRGTILWSIITTVGIFVFFVLKLAEFQFPILISQKGMMIAQGLILFGWIFIATCVIWAYIFMVEENAAKLEHSKKKTQNLINVLSHDISTPLTVISSKINLLLKSSLNEAQLNAAAKAYKACERLNQITESVRDMRLNDLGKKEMILSEVNVRDLIIELKDIFSEKLEQKNLRLNWSVASDVYNFYSSRSLLLNQILGNLLSNSIKFSPANSEIRLRVSKVDNAIQFLLEDSGMGISPDMRENVFEANLSRTSLGTEGELGTGFGLPIVKNCMDRLGGKISFITKTSEEGPSGTRFKLSFPLS